jgi:glutamine amidotransferase
MRIAVIKYNAGNIRSVAFALERLGVDFVITDSESEIRGSDKVIFPGVGEANSTMSYLKDRKLDAVIRDLKQPVLGICLGMQLMCSYSEENNTDCMGIFDERVKKFHGPLKVPHMGWNNLEKVKDWLDPTLNGNFVYFVHSYYVPLSPYAVAETNYATAFSAALRKDNFYAVQFHPEKSADAGIKVLNSFLKHSI